MLESFVREEEVVSGLDLDVGTRERAGLQSVCQGVEMILLRGDVMESCLYYPAAMGGTQVMRTEETQG